MYLLSLPDLLNFALLHNLIMYMNLCTHSCSEFHSYLQIALIFCINNYITLQHSKELNAQCAEL